MYLITHISAFNLLLNGRKLIEFATFADDLLATVCYIMIFALVTQKKIVMIT